MGLYPLILGMLHIPPKKKYQIRLDEEVALKLPAEFDEEERISRERAKKEQEANIALMKHGVIFKKRLIHQNRVGERKRKREGEELIQESTKIQKVEDDKEKAELKQIMETIPDEEEVAIDVIPLTVKSLRIVD
nr:hypothetical protein [Tanacetum cinerariifolium]